MHEMGIALQIIEIATASIPEDMTSARVERVNLSVGKLAAVVPKSLRFCFDIAARETRLAGAELRIREIPIQACCKDCGHEWHIDQPVFTCPECRGGRLEILSGRELDIDSIEIAEDKETDDADSQATDSQTFSP